MPEATYYQEGETLDYTPASALSSGAVIQMSDGRAAIAVGDIAASTQGAMQVCGVAKFTKAAGFVALAGGKAFWDHSANAITYLKVNDKDFYVGRFTADATSASTECYVAMNVNPPANIDLLRDAALSVATGTVAAGGFDLPKLYGGSRGLSLTSTNEAQCVDMLSVDRVAIASNPIAEFVFRLGANGSTSAVDINIGLANGTSTTDADAITEHVFVHIDGGALDILAQSKDGTTTVTATDTTVDATAGSAVANRFEVWMDCRDPADVQIYINGSLVLGSTVFALGAGTGPIGLLAHVEKTSGTATAGPVYIDRAELRTMEQ